LAEIVAVAKNENVDLILVAGDFYETSAPSPESEKIVNDTLIELGQVAPVVAIAGNHDNARKFDALTPLVSQRSIIRVDELMTGTGFENALSYEDRLRSLIDALTAGFDSNSVNIVLAHAFVVGGVTGGGERQAHIADEYSIPSTAFPVTANYVALGHLHRPQKVLGATAIHYSGSPLQLDFGESDQVKQVNIVEVAPGLPAKVRPVTLTSGKKLRTLTGTLSQLAGYADEVGDDWLRVRVEEPNRAGLASEVRELLGQGVVDVRVEKAEVRAKRKRREGATPKELFSEYLSERNIDDPELITRFASLHDAAVGSDIDGDDTDSSGADTALDRQK